MAKSELDYFDFSLEPGLKASERLSNYVGNVYVSVITYYTFGKVVFCTEKAGKHTR